MRNDYIGEFVQGAALSTSGRDTKSLVTNLVYTQCLLTVINRTLKYMLPACTYMYMLARYKYYENLMRTMRNGFEFLSLFQERLSRSKNVFPELKRARVFGA